MNFGASNSEQNVFKSASRDEPVFKSASAVFLPPPQPIGFGGLPSVAPMVPPVLGMNNPVFGKQQVFDRIDVDPTPKFSGLQLQTSEFPVFNGEPKQLFGVVSAHEPAHLRGRIEEILDHARGVDFYRVDDSANAIRGRCFGQVNNAEFEICVFAWSGSEGKSYAEFNRWCGDGWEFSNFVTTVLREFGENIPVRPQLPPIPAEYNQMSCSPSDLAAMLVDVEQSYQDVSEHAAAELAIQTQNTLGRRMCEQIEEFCPRVFKILETSSNCAIVRSLLICLMNMSQGEGVIRQILSERSHVIENIGQKWAQTQSMCGGLYTIAPSQEVARHVGQLLMVA